MSFYSSHVLAILQELHNNNEDTEHQQVFGFYEILHRMFLLTTPQRLHDELNRLEKEGLVVSICCDEVCWGLK